MRAALRAASFLVLPLVAAAAPARAAPPGGVNPAVAAMVAEVSPGRLEATVRKLVSFGTRNSLSDTESPTHGIGAARRWIRGRLEECASDAGGRLRVAFDEHDVASGPRVPRPTKFVNVVATLAGSQAASRERIYVVSGHYDSMPTSPVDGRATRRAPTTTPRARRSRWSSPA